MLWGMAVRKTISVRDDDLAVWDYAERFAARTRTPISGLVILALSEYVSRRDPKMRERLGERDWPSDPE